MPRILLTGVSTLDIINQVTEYPAEDSEVRAITQEFRSGGNASNMAIVIRQLGIQASLLANRADDDHAQRVFSELHSRHIDISLCPIQKNSVTPTSYITLSQRCGSRSIVHYRKLDELHSGYFQTLDLHRFDWLHFEARECSQLLGMLKHCQPLGTPISIELEKPRHSIDDVMDYADVLLISRPFAESRGFTSAHSCLAHFSQLYADKIITCTWGSQGAWAYQDSHVIHQTAFNVDSAIETLAAGDTFNAGFIASLIKKQTLTDSLLFACRLASQKCQQSGLDHLTIPV